MVVLEKEKLNLGWICTDSDSYQYCKQIGDREFQFVEMIWLDTCRGDEGYPDKDYTVKSACVDLNDYNPGEIECCIASYGYENLDDMYEKCGMEIEQLIAECIFEEMCDGSATTYGMMTKDEAKEFIKDYIKKYN